MPDGNPCPQCGTSLPSGALAGLCPACLLKMGAAADTVTEGKQPAFTPPSVAELAPLFPQLEILELIGKGGMGAVYKARQKQLDRIVALKILPPGIGNDVAFSERFTREAKALAKLNHPGIVTLYEFGVAPGVPPVGDGGAVTEALENSGVIGSASANPGGRMTPSTSSKMPDATVNPGSRPPLYFFLMEFVDGVNLRQLLHAGRVSTREALAIVPQICDALQFAHDAGIVHRDIKPENILIDRRGRVKVADFGLAKIVGTDAPRTPSLSTSDGERVAVRPGEGTPALTDAGKVMGTPQYMSPEQIHAPGEVDHRADIYALGVVFYQMLTGELPGKRIEAPSKKVSIDVRLDEVVLRALERKPELRYQQASALKTEVETLAADAGSSDSSVPKTAAHPGHSLAPGNAGFAAAVTFFYAGVVLSILFIGALPFHFSRDHACLLGVGLLLVVAPFVGMAVAKALRQARVSAENVRWQTLAARLKAASVVAWLLALPVIGFAIFFLIALFSERGGWNPALSEAVFVPLTWLGAVLLPLSGKRLWKAAALGSSGRATAQTESGHDRTNQGQSVAAANQTLRFSRTAIVGVCISVLSATAFFLAYVVDKVATKPVMPDGQILPNQPAMLVGFMLLGVGLLCAFLTTLFGWVAVSQIRRAAGKLCGLGLAVFDGLCFPLLALSGLVIWAGNVISSLIPPKLSPILVPVLVGLIALAVYRLTDSIIRRVWLAVNQRNDLAPSTAEEQASANKGRLTGQLVVGGIIAVILMAAVAPQLRKLTGSRFGKRSTISMGVDWLETHRLNQIIAPGSSGQGRYGDDDYGYEVLFSPDSAALTVTYRKEPGNDYRVLVQSKDGATSPLRAIIHATRNTVVEEKAMLSRPEFDDIAALILQARRHGERQPDISFGAVIERTINRTTNASNCLIRFKTGELLSPPAQVPRSEHALHRWAQTQSVDAAVGLFHPDVLCGFDMMAISAPPELWDNLTPAQVVMRLEWQTRNVFQIMSHGQSPSFPDTCIFKTREGGVGILQVLQHTANPPGLKVRYKYLQQAPAVTRKPIDPAILTKTWSLQLTPGEKADLNQIREEIKARMDAGDYEGALERQVWYFDHALEHGEVNPVRLSFGITHWGELGRRYPKAKEALVNIRDRKAAEFATGRGSFSLFQEVEALNRELQDDAATLELFRQIERQDAALAEQCRIIVRTMEKRMAGQPATAPKLSFGPVVERVVQVNTNTLNFIDFQTGRVLTNRFMSIDEQSLRSWIDTNGLDVVAIPLLKREPSESGRQTDVATGQALFGLKGHCWFARARAGEGFENITEDIEIHLRHAKTQTEDGGYTTSSEPYWFETSDGARGVVQISSYFNTPGLAQIRYKLVQQKIAEATSTTAVSSGQIHEGEGLPAELTYADQLARHAWELGYNLTTNFPAGADRWVLVELSIKLLRDEGLKKSADAPLIYRELAWVFQQKLAANLDDANMVYKQEWLKEMSEVFGKQEPNLDELLHPKDADALHRLNLLTNKYKMDPVFMKQVDDQYGPLEWRLPESHAIYWAALGLEKARENPTKVKADELIQLRRSIYQSMQLAFQRGRLISDPYTRSFEFGPNLDIIEKVSATYEQAMKDEPNMRNNIETAHRNFLGNAAYFLYANDRIPEALKWFRVLGEKYPNKPLLNNKLDSTPSKISLEEFCLGRIVEDVSETSRDRVTAVLLGHARTGYRMLALGDRKKFEGLRQLSRMLYKTYMKNIGEGANTKRIGLAPVEKTEEEVLRELLDPEKSPWPFEMRAALRSKLELPREEVPRDEPRKK